MQDKTKQNKLNAPHLIQETCLLNSHLLDVHWCRFQTVVPDPHGCVKRGSQVEPLLYGCLCVRYGMESIKNLHF